MPLPGINVAFTGPATVAAGGVSAAFTLTPEAPITVTVTPNDSGAGGSFTPSSVSWAASGVPMTFVYNAPLGAGSVVITPVAGVSINPIVFVPPFLDILVLGSGVPQHTYNFPQVAGVSPFQMVWWQDQVPAAGAPIVPPTTTSSGQFEWGNGTITGLAAGAEYTIYGPTQVVTRVGMKDVLTVSATGVFNLDYLFTPDQGMSWYIGKQVQSTSVTVDGGTAGYTQEARVDLQLGYQFMIVVYNTSSGAINLAWEKRLVQRRN